MRLLLAVSEQFFVDIMCYDVMSMEARYAPVIVDHKPICLGTVLRHWSSFVHEMSGDTDVLLELEIPNDVFTCIVLEDGTVVQSHDCEKLLRGISYRKESVIKVILEHVKAEWVVCYHYLEDVFIVTVVLNDYLCPLWSCTIAADTVESKALPDKCYGGFGLYDVCDYLSTSSLFGLMNRVDYTRPSELKKYAESHGYPTIEEVFGKL